MNIHRNKYAYIKTRKYYIRYGSIIVQKAHVLGDFPGIRDEPSFLKPDRRSRQSKRFHKNNVIEKDLFLHFFGCYTGKIQSK